MKWTVKLLVCTEQANQLCKAHFNQAHKNSGLWLNWTTTGSTWNRSWDGMRKNRGSNSRSGYLWRSQLLWVSSLVWLQHRHKEQISLLACFSLLSEEDDAHHTHTCVSASTPSHPRFYRVLLITSVSGTRQDMRVFYARLITLHATISHPVSAASFEYRSLSWLSGFPSLPALMFLLPQGFWNRDEAWSRKRCLILRFPERSSSLSLHSFYFG